MQALVTVVHKSTEPHDVLLSVEDDATVADVTRVLIGTLGPPPPAGPWDTAARPGTPELWLDGRRADPDDPAGPLLRDGMRVAVDPEIGPLLRSGEPSGQYELRVAGGPGAGRVARLGVGSAAFGSAPACTVTVGDRSLPPTAGSIRVEMNGRVTLRPGPGVPMTLDDEPVTAEREWPMGGMLQIGDSLLVLDRPARPDAHLAPTGEGGLAYNRPPRLSAVRPRPRLARPAEPRRPEGARLNLITAMVPMAFGLAMYVITGMILMLLFCLMSPLMVFGQYLQDRRYGKKTTRQQLKQYHRELAEYQDKLEEYGRQDQRARRTDSPDPAELLLFATGPRRRLWERRLTDPDAMRLRIGAATLPADIEIVPGGGAAATTFRPEDAPEPPVVTNVPVTLPFGELGVVGVAGDRPRALNSARWLALQAAVLHSPRDLSVVVLSSAPDAAADWSWAHWLPHTTPQQGQNCLALIASDNELLGRRVSELLTELDRRAALSESPNWNAAGGIRPEPHILVVLDGARLLRRVPGVPRLLQEGPGHGILALCVDEDERLLPEECRAALTWTPESAGRLRVRGHGMESAGLILADQVTPAWCELVARSLAPIRDVSRDDADAALPASARLLTLLDLPNPTGPDIERRWQAGGQTTSAVIGAASDGPFALDIRRDGPHALVAGTTGAGKSELLQSIIASLAVANHPESLNYVLIDYKGGSAFQDCAELPHTVGMVSDLDAHLTERALASLAAELHRRETILFTTGNKDIEDYHDHRLRHPECAPMPRLVIVIDEFASLVAELPDFIAGLVDIARRGRSLGVHLVLATQRPAGVVSADIRANTNLRMALRVTSGEESADVIDAPDARAIAKSTPGRMYVRSGAQSLVGVQSARIGGRRPREDTSGPRAALTPLSWPALGRPAPRRAEAEDDGTMVTDLAVLVEAVRDGARRMGFGEPRRPWLEPLPEKIALDALPPGADPAAGDVAPVPFGVTDLPAQQRRAPLALDLVDGDHMMFIGGPRSGRSSTLRTLAGAVARTASPADVHLYAIDCGSNALLPLAGLPHTGAVVTRDQPDRVRRLLDRLRSEITRRQQLLADQGVASAAEQRATAGADERLPWMVLFLDGWEGYVSAFEKFNYGQLIDTMHGIFREASTVGLKVVMTADRSGFSGQLSSSFPNKLILRLADGNDYQSAGFRTKDVPGSMPPGRALRLADHGLEESQVGLLVEDDSGQAQVAEIHRIAREARERVGTAVPKPLRPMRVDALPSRISLDEALALEPELTSPSPLWAMVAVGGDELRPVGVDLERSGPGFVIAGPPRSGRSNTLLVAARSLLRQGTPIVAVTPRRSPLRGLAGSDGVLGVLTGESTAEDLKGLLEQVSARPFVVVVDDAELVYDTPLDKPLEEVVRSGMDGEHGLIAAGALDSLGSQYRGFVVAARKSRCGMLLRPQNPADGELFGARLPSNSAAGPPGSGLVVMEGTLSPVVSPLADG